MGSNFREAQRVPARHAGEGNADSSGVGRDVGAGGGRVRPVGGVLRVVQIEKICPDTQISPPQQVSREGKILVPK